MPMILLRSIAFVLVLSSGAGAVTLRTVGPPLDQLFRVKVKAGEIDGAGASRMGMHYQAEMIDDAFSIELLPTHPQGPTTDFRVHVGGERILGHYGPRDVYLTSPEGVRIPVPDFNVPTNVTSAIDTGDEYIMTLDGPYWRGEMFLGTVSIGGELLDVHMVEAGYIPREVTMIPEPGTWVLGILSVIGLCAGRVALSRHA